MTTPKSARSFLIGEVEALEPFDFVVVAPAGSPLHVVEVTCKEDGGLEMRIPGRPRLVPALDTRVCGALRERDFISEDPTDPTKPWVQDIADPEAAVLLMEQLRVEVFGDKSDVPLDVAHGSHKAEHDSMQKLSIARTRIEAIVTDVLGTPAQNDKDGDYVLPIGEIHLTVAPRVTPEGQVVVRVFAITNVGINVAPELGLLLARLNFGMMFGRFALDAEHKSIWVDETLLGEEFREEELRFAINTIATTADEWDDRLKQMFGGATYQEILAGRSAEPVPSSKPGEGIGMYL
jgi:hypothetical protein